MKLETRQQQANEAAEKWRRQYAVREGTIACQWSWGDESHPQNNLNRERYEQLVTLGEIPDPDKVDEIIGNDSWSHPTTCSEYGARDKRPIVELGEEPDYESNTAYICEECLRKVLALIEGSKT